MNTESRARKPEARVSQPAVCANTRSAASLSLSIQVDAEAGELPVGRARIRRWVNAALEHDARLLLRFVGSSEGRALNARFRARDKATNVLTFAYESEPTVEADIVVCLAVVRDEAAGAGIPLADHLAHLVIHGVLHAQGHDHEEETAAQAMEAAEVRILRRFRIDDPYRNPESGASD